jgi:precorrin-6B methylase 2
MHQGSPEARPPAFDSSGTEQEPFIGAMHTIARRIAPGIVAAIQPAEAKKLLDIGGASGSYTEAFLRDSPNIQATLFDLPSVIQIAQRRLADTDLLDRMTLLVEGFKH